jgi:hypothetical protein
MGAIRIRLAEGFSPQSSTLRSRVFDSGMEHTAEQLLIYCIRKSTNYKPYSKKVQGIHKIRGLEMALRDE